MSRPLLEICIDDAAGLDAAIAGGADRVEVCAVLELGGLTPTPGLLALAAAAPVAARAMIRHRPGDFVFSPAEEAAMLADIAACGAAGIEGVVLGASRADGRLDTRLLARLAAAAGPMRRTLHRAFDLVPDFAEAIEIAVELGFDTILTAGGARDCLAGADNLARIAELAAGRIAIMPGAGVTPAAIARLRRTLPLAAVHGSASEPAAPATPPAQQLGFVSPARRRTSRPKVAALRAALDTPA